MMRKWKDEVGEHFCWENSSSCIWLPTVLPASLRPCRSLKSKRTNVYVILTARYICEKASGEGMLDVQRTGWRTLRYVLSASISRIWAWRSKKHVIVNGNQI